MMPAVTFDSSSTAKGEASIFTFQHACAGTDRALLVGVSINHDSTTVTGVTYGGVALTQQGALSATFRAELWSLAAPAAGVNDVVVTLSASAKAVVGATSWTNVDQDDPVGSLSSASGSSASPNVVASSASPHLVHDVLAVREGLLGNQTATAGAGQTQRWNDKTTGGVPVNLNVLGAGSAEPGAASVTMSWSLAFSSVWIILAASLRRAPLRVQADLAAASATSDSALVDARARAAMEAEAALTARAGSELPIRSGVTSESSFAARLPGDLASGAGVIGESLMRCAVTAMNVPAKLRLLEGQIAALLLR
jgi:hypothetical protein